MRKTVILEALLIGAIMILLIFSTITTPWGVLNFLSRDRYLLSIVLSILYIAVCVIISFVIYRYLESEKHESYRLEAEQFIFPMIVPILLYVYLGYYVRFYLGFAAAALLGLVAVLTMKYIKSKKSQVSWTRLHLVGYSIMMTSIWFLSVIIGYAINYY